MRAAAERSKDGPQARRLLAVAAITTAHGTEAAKTGASGCRSFATGWSVNAQGPDGLIDRKAPGQPPRLNDAHRAALAANNESGPIPAIHGVVRWRIDDLCQWISRNTATTTPSRRRAACCARWVRKLSARPRHHAQTEGAIEDFEKVFRSAWKRSAARRARSDAIEVWIDDEARIGQKNKITRRGPSAERVRALTEISEPPRLIYAAQPRKDGKGAALVLPRCDTEAMNLHGRNRHPDRAGRARRAARRSGRLASLRAA